MTEFEKHKEEERLRRGYSDSYLSAIKRRLNLQMIGNYIRDDGEKTCLNNDSFHERENNAFSKLENLLIEKYGENERSEIISQICAYAGVVQEIYFSLGMKAGAILQCKLTDNFETDI